MEFNTTDQRSAQEILSAVTPSEWVQVHEELRTNANYKSHNTLGNLQLILDKFRIKKQARELADGLLTDPTLGIAGDITFALATGQPDIFDEKIRKLQDSFTN